MSSPKQWTVKSVNDVTCSSDVIYGDDIFRKMEGIESENLIKQPCLVQTVELYKYKIFEYSDQRLYQYNEDDFSF